MYGLLPAFLAFVCLAILLSRIRRDLSGRARLELSPVFFWLGALLCYGFAMPASRLLFGSPDTEVDFAFIGAHTLAAAGLLLGILFSNAMGLYSRQIPVLSKASPDEPGGPVLLFSMLTVHGLFYFSWLNQVEYNLWALFSEYGFGDRNYEEATLLTTALGVLSAASAWGAFYKYIYRREGTAAARATVAFAVAMMALFDIVRGNRNAFLILSLPILVMSLRGKLVSLRNVALFGVLAWLGLYSIGIVRNWGFARMDDVSFSWEAFDPLNGEFGTAYSVYSKVVAGNVSDDALGYGSSYVIDPAVNLIPRQLWPERPMTIAQVESVSYYGRGILALGIGFSPIVEALSNFGWFGVLPIFFVMSVLLSWLENVCDGRDGWCTVYYGALAPMFINFWRIDFATVFKMSLLHLASVGVVLWLFSASRRGNRQGIEQRGRPLAKVLL